MCEIVGVTQQRRQALVGRGLLGKTPATGASIHDAIELASLVALSDRLEPSAVAVAWEQLRPTLREVIGSRVDVIFDVQLGTITVAQSADQLRELVAHGRPVRVIALGERLQAVRDGFRRWAAAAPFRPRRSSAKSARRSGA